MTRPSRRSDAASDEALWAHHHAELRDPHRIAVQQWQGPAHVDPALLECTVRRGFRDALEAAGRTLIVTREYEHLAISLAVVGGRLRTGVLRLPHPNGVAVDPQRGRVYIAATRNPNMVFEFAPADRLLERDGAGRDGVGDLAGALVPVGCRYLPGCLYLHDLAVIGGRLYANAVAMNAVVELPADGGFRPVWWPECIDAPAGPKFGRNYLQLNSIAAGPTLRDSYFSASAAAPSARRPGHRNFPVDRRGVIFSGRTRQPVAGGLTRPHSARLAGGELWVDNSGYGEFGRVDRKAGTFEPVVRLPGWTRGAGVVGNVAFVATSRVIPRFAGYAPGLDVDTARCGLHAIDLRTGRVLGSLWWPRGNQIFAVEPVGLPATVGFPFTVGGTRSGRARERCLQLFFRGMPGGLAPAR